MIGHYIDTVDYTEIEVARYGHPDLALFRVVWTSPQGQQDDEILTAQEVSDLITRRQIVPKEA